MALRFYLNSFVGMNKFDYTVCPALAHYSKIDQASQILKKMCLKVLTNFAARLCCAHLKLHTGGMDHPNNTFLD